jgi:hypothetical protein
VEQRQPSSQPVQFGLALTAGGGLILMIIALGIGVVSADAGSLVGTLFLLGLLLLIVGIVAWIGYTRPFANFDDINEAKYHGHAHDDHAHADDDAVLLPDGMTETPALAGGEATAALPAGHGH